MRIGISCERLGNAEAERLLREHNLEFNAPAARHNRWRKG